MKFTAVIGTSMVLFGIASSAHAEPATAAEGDFAAHCASCHGADRKGHVGVPNLSDKIWLWSGDVASIETTENNHEH